MTESQPGTFSQCKVHESIVEKPHFMPKFKSFPGHSYPFRYFHFDSVLGFVVVVVVIIVVVIKAVVLNKVVVVSCTVVVKFFVDRDELLRFDVEVVSSFAFSVIEFDLVILERSRLSLVIILEVLIVSVLVVDDLVVRVVLGATWHFIWV